MTKSTRWILGIILASIFFLGAVTGLVVKAMTNTPDFTELKSAVTVTMPLPHGGKFTRKVGPKAPGWAPLGHISNHLLSAVISSEDASFYSHKGIDFEELKEAIRKDIQEKRWARGASTITQQVIKNVYLGREKTLWRKFKEFIWARELEKRLTKSEILCFYVNLVEWGPKIYGIKQAAHHYFSTEPMFLTPKQSAFLALLLPAPTKYYSYFRNQQLSAWAFKRVNHILRVMNRMGFLDNGDYEIARVASLWGEAVPTEISVGSDEAISPDAPAEEIFSEVESPSIQILNVDNAPSVAPPEGSHLEETDEAKSGSSSDVLFDVMPNADESDSENDAPSP